ERRTARLQRHMWWSAWIRAYVSAPMRAYRCACPISTKAALSSSMARLPDLRPTCASRSAALRQRAGVRVKVHRRLMRCMFMPSYVATGVPSRAWHALCRPDTSRHKTPRRMFSRQEPCRARDVARLFSTARVSGGAPQTVRTARVYSTQEACLRCDGKLQDGCAVVWYGTVLARCSSVQDRPAGLLHRGAAWRRCQGNIRSDVRWGRSEERR